MGEYPFQAQLFKEFHHQAHFVKDTKNETFTFTSGKILKI